MKKTNNITVENARIMFRNFAGAAGRFTPEGKRTFCVPFEQEVGRALAEDGWNIKFLTPRDEQEDPLPYLNVQVAYGNFPPKIVLVTTRGKTLLDENMVSVLDYAEIENVDLIIRPYHWEVNGKTGVKAYVKTMYVTIKEDEFESKYYDVPEAAQPMTDAD